MSKGEPAGVRAAAAALLRCEILAIERVGGGGNNEIFRITTPERAFALKRYVDTPGDERDRIGREYNGLTLLSRAGEADVPRPVALDRDAHIALFEWIDGTRVDRLSADDINAALAFLARLHACGRQAEAARLRPAVEACLDAGAMRAQVALRLKRLRLAGDAEPLLAAFLADPFEPAWREMEQQLGPSDVLPRACQTLSPSDFGSHNMLRRHDGRLMFLDFEYFGWDDPVKLVADIVWHPGSALAAPQQARFITGAQRIFGQDRDYAARFARRAPTFGLRWALIVLSEFLPERWERRRRAGERGDWSAVKKRQLAKARAITERAVRAHRLTPA